MMALRPDLQAWIDEQVKAGAFKDATAVIEHLVERAIDADFEDDDPNRRDPAFLRSLDEADAAFDRGESIPFEVVAEQIMQKHFGRGYTRHR